MNSNYDELTNFLCQAGAALLMRDAGAKVSTEMGLLADNFDHGDATDQDRQLALDILNRAEKYLLSKEQEYPDAAEQLLRIRTLQNQMTMELNSCDHGKNDF